MKQNEIKIESIQIGLAGPRQIEKWAKRILPNGRTVGKVSTSKTVNYKTLKPEPGGLFCEKIFGPVNNFECSCGNRKSSKAVSRFCPICDVEFTDSRVRRYRLGYISLAYPVTHIWYLKGRPSFISLLLGMTRKEVQSVVYNIHSMYTQRMDVKKLDMKKVENRILYSNFLKHVNIILKKPRSHTSIATYKQIFFLKKYRISKLQENNYKKTLFTTEFTTIFNNSYYSDLHYLGFKSIQILQSTINTFMSLKNKKKKVFKGKKNTLNKHSHVYILQHSIPSLLIKKKIFVNSNIKLKKDIFFSTTKFKKNFFSSDIDPKNKFETKINTYYPIDSKHIFEDVKDPKNDPLFDSDLAWAQLSFYLTSEFFQNDRVLSTYSYRVTNQSIKNADIKYKNELLKINNINYLSRGYVTTGSEAIWYLLKTLNTSRTYTKLQMKLTHLDNELKKYKLLDFLYEFEEKTLQKTSTIRLKALRRFKLFQYFKKNNLHASWLVICNLPVLPPDLRPIIQLDANQLAVSDLNQLYKRVLDRNNRLRKYRKKMYFFDLDFIKFNQRLLQEAVDALIANGKGGTPLASAPNGRAFKSLSDILKGKKGRFRQNLLGKRVDYSGRSVIIVDPELKLHECGLPKEMAIELFHPFLLRALIDSKKIITGAKAKKIIRERQPKIWKILQKILRTHLILLNRAPTLHRLGIQAFKPKLIEGRAILLHPLVCPAFNADFDGDQMAVHVPLCAHAQAEAWKLMWSINNILSPATGQPIIIPTQDMILGCYYLTTNLHESVISNTKYSKLKQQISHIFSTLDEVLMFFHQNKISIHSLILLQSKNLVQMENFYEKPLEIRINFFGNSTQIYSKYWRNLDIHSNTISHFIYTTTGRVILNKVIFKSLEA